MNTAANSTTRPDRNEMYTALVRRDSRYEGVFFAAIRTTGIFCRPTCTARKPNQENVEYFPSARDALAHGYRPCKICQPMRQSGEYPEWLQPVMAAVEADPSLRLTDADLRTMGICPERVRRWFTKNHGITFQSHLRMRRINEAFGQLRQGEQVTQEAIRNGYDSISGFATTFKRTTGFAPSDSASHQIITITRILSPLGPLLAGAADEGICLLEFTDRRMLETQLNRLRRHLGAATMPGACSHFAALTEQLDEYFVGTRQHFDLPLVIPGTEFQRNVWSQLQTIPYGTTRTYAAQAAAVGNPQAVRAVARANGDNRLAIIIPCHRVIGSNGKLTGYGGGLWRKEWLLAHEKKHATFPLTTTCEYDGTPPVSPLPPA